MCWLRALCSFPIIEDARIKHDPWYLLLLIYTPKIDISSWQISCLRWSSVTLLHLSIRQLVYTHYLPDFTLLRGAGLSVNITAIFISLVTCLSFIQFFKLHECRHVRYTRTSFGIIGPGSKTDPRIWYLKTHKKNNVVEAENLNRQYVTVFTVKRTIALWVLENVKTIMRAHIFDNLVRRWV